MYTWAKRFNRTHRKIGAYNFASQHTHLKGDANNDNSCYLYSTGHMCLDLSSSHDTCQKRKIKGIEGKTLTLCIKVKDRPFAEGTRGCHAFICLYAQSLSARERHIVFPLKMTTFIMQYVAFILNHPSSHNTQFSLTLNDITLLEAIFIAFLHRWQLTWGILLNP